VKPALEPFKKKGKSLIARSPVPLIFPLDRRRAVGNSIRMQPPLHIAVRILPHGMDLPLPEHATEGAAGMDLRAALPADEPALLRPGARMLVPTGLVLEIPPGHEGQVRPRSGLALKHGVTCLNAPGTIDSDYRGEIGVILANLGNADFLVERGLRIAQLVIAPYRRAILEPAPDLAETERGARGFGSTGTR